MEAQQAQQFSKSQLESINTCRLYLQVTTLAELSNENGTNILSYALKGTLDPNTNQPQLWTYSKSTLDWPYQERPPTKAWNIWKRFLLSFTTNTPELRLSQSLGPWLPGVHTQRKWKYIQLGDDIVTTSTPHAFYSKLPNRVYQQTYQLQQQRLLVLQNNHLPVIPLHITHNTIVRHATTEDYQISEYIPVQQTHNPAILIPTIHQNIQHTRIDTIQTITNGTIHEYHISFSGIL
jgi:hypothetical protein